MRDSIARTLTILGGLILVGSCGDQTEREGRVDPVQVAALDATASTITGVAHGVMLTKGGKTLRRTPALTLAAQAYYVARLYGEASPSVKTAFDAKRAALSPSATASTNAQVSTNAELIGWLIAQVKPSDAVVLVEINGFLRRGSQLAALDAIEVTQGALKTTTSSSGQTYINECALNRVPTPPAWRSSSWVNRGELAPNFLERFAEVYTYTSTNPRGICIALPRSDTSTSDIDALGIICQGNETNKACFWDNATIIPRATTPTLPIAGASFNGGGAMVGKGGGICTDCHAGENAFVIHPNTALDAVGTNWLTPNNWVNPMVAGVWPQNRRPGRKLDLMAVPPSESCVGCHTKSERRRFPRTEELTKYCGWIAGNSYSLTMPPSSPNSPAYFTHGDALKTGCINSPLPAPIPATHFDSNLLLGHSFFSVNGEVPMMGDFNNDGRSDIITFQLTTNDVYVALSHGGAFGGTQFWQGGMGATGETPRVGDFNGDGNDDIIAFTTNASGHTYVALSSGAAFGATQFWGNSATTGQVPVVGDFNNDGRDDIATLTKGSTNDALVKLSNGSGFGGATLWNNTICSGSQLPFAGDFNGDGYDDIACFTRGTTADVFVYANSASFNFSGPVKWHDFFAQGAEVPRVADVNGDGFDDIIVFVRGSGGQVYVALSTGTSFGPTQLWHNHLGVHNEIPDVGDMDGDGRADAVVFAQGSNPAVYVAKAIP